MWELAHFVAVTRPGYSSPEGVKLPEGKVDTLEIPIGDFVHRRAPTRRTW